MAIMTYLSSAVRLGPITAIGGASETVKRVPARVSGLLLALIVAVTPVSWAQSLETGSIPTVTSEAASQAPPATFCCQKKHFWVAAAEVLALEIIPNYFNHFVSDDTTAVLSWDSFSHNVRNGFEWDPNSLATNMFAHPFHGNVYFNTGRSNGYNFWESQAFAFAGSFIWEMFGENNRGAINDWAMTSLGGITIGEALHRAAIMVRDNEARGVSRAFSEFGGFLIDPVGGFSRVVRGEWSKYGPNPEDRFPDAYSSSISVGYRLITEGRLTDAQKATGYFEFRARYGDPMREFSRPFDAFEMNLQLNAADASTIGLWQVHGTLYGSTLKRSDNALHVITVDQLYDYANTNTYEVGDMAYAVTLRSRWRMSDRVNFETVLQPNLAVMSAVSSEYAGFTGRSYDFGPGLGLHATAGVNGGALRAQVGYRGLYTHTTSGAKGNQIVHFVSANLGYRFWRSLGVTADYRLHLRNSFYNDYPDIHRRAPEFRIGALFAFGG
jgi:hypothetical protein